MKKAILKGVVLIELLAVVGTFKVWRSMNSDQGMLLIYLNKSMNKSYNNRNVNSLKTLL